MSEIVRLPRKLSVSGGSLAEAGRFHPVGALGITLNVVPLNRVTMTIAKNDLDVSIHDWVEVYNHNGSVGIYRVTKVRDAPKRNIQVEMSHGLDVFSDASFSSIEKYSGTVNAFLQKVVDAQTQTIGGVKYWRLGTVEDTRPWNKDIKHDNLMECLTDIAKTEEDYIFTFDMSSFPWTLNFVARDNAVLSEFRISRNMENCSYDLDDADQCTHLYLSVTTETEETVTDESGEVHVAGTKTEEGYYTYNDAVGQADWGIIDKTAGVLRKDVPTDAALAAWVAAYFDRHRNPGLQITIEGDEYNRLTGESIDRTYIGRICRVAIPDCNILFLERFISINYPDALRAPTRVKASLSSKRQTAEGSFAEIRQNARRGGGGAAKAKADNLETDLEKQKIIYDLRVEKDDKHFAIIATEEWYEEMEEEGRTLVGHYDGKFEVTARKMTSAFSVTGVALDEDGFPEIDSDGNYVFDGSGNTLSSQITQTATMITSEVSRATAAEGTLGSRITQTADSITSEVNRAKSAEETLSSTITQTATSLTSLYQKTGVNSLGQSETLYSKITQTASGLTSEVSRATAAEGTLSSRITQTESSIELKVSKGEIASTINQTAQSVKIQASKINLEGYVTVSELDAEKARFDNLTSGTLHATALSATLLQATGNLNVGGTNYSATTLKIGSVVSATVLSSSRATIELNHSHSIEFQINNTTGDVTATIGSAQATDGTDSFNIADTEFFQTAASAGYTEGLNAVTIVKGSWSGGIISFTKSAGTASTKTISLSAGSVTWGTGDNVNKASVPINDWNGSSSTSTGYTVTVDATTRYNAGYSSGETAGKNAVTITKGAWSGGRISFTKSEGTASTKSISLSAGSTTWGTGDNVNKASVPINDTNGSSSTSTGYTVTVDATTRYNAGYSAGETAGKNAVTIVKGSWDSGGISFTKSTGTQSSAAIQIATETATWSGNLATVQLRDSTIGTRIGFSVQVDASARYTAGETAGKTAGWSDARSKVAAPSSGTGTSFSFKGPSETEGDQQTWTFTMQKGATPGSSGYASVALNSTVVARIDIGDWYTAGQEAGHSAGWSDARSKIVSPTAGTGTTFSFKGPSATEGNQQTWSFSISKDTPSASGGYVSVYCGSTRVGLVSVGDWYNAGFAAGEGQFSSVSLTLQGEAVSVRKQGSAVSVTLQGSTGPLLSDYGSAQLYIKNTSGSYIAVGSSRHWYYVSSTGVQYYKAGSTATYYNYGSASTYYIAGTTTSEYYSKN